MGNASNMEKSPFKSRETRCKKNGIHSARRVGTVKGPCPPGRQAGNGPIITNSGTIDNRSRKTALTKQRLCGTITKSCGISSSGRVTASQAVGGEFETRIPLQKRLELYDDSLIQGVFFLRDRRQESKKRILAGRNRIGHKKIP